LFIAKSQTTNLKILDGECKPYLSELKDVKARLIAFLAGNVGLIKTEYNAFLKFLAQIDVSQCSFTSIDAAKMKNDFKAWKNKFTAICGHIEICESYKKTNSIPDLRNNELHALVETTCQPALVMYMVEKQPLLLTKKHNGKTPEEVAKVAGNTSIARLLQEMGSTLEAKTLKNQLSTLSEQAKRQKVTMDERDKKIQQLEKTQTKSKETVERLTAENNRLTGVIGEKDSSIQAYIDKLAKLESELKAKVEKNSHLSKTISEKDQKIEELSEINSQQKKEKMQYSYRPKDELAQISDFWKAENSEKQSKKKGQGRASSHGHFSDSNVGGSGEANKDENVYN
jgi:DNA repair exonuclease SbcCD ATPase subunit